MKIAPVRRTGLCTLISLAVLSVASIPLHAAGNEKLNAPRSTLTNDSYRPFLINNIFNYYGNNGDGSNNPFSTNNEGFEFPIGTTKTTVFQDGLVWGGYHKGRAVPKVGGSVYRHGLQAGPIIANGGPSTDPIAADASLPAYRMYRVRPDVHPGKAFADVEAMLNADEVSSIARFETVTARDLYDRYVEDWNEWPAAIGAPFTDVDTNGAYDPAVDVPGQPGADQTLWYVSNDLDTARTQYLAGCPPIGIEMQRTIWGYRRGGVIGNTIFSSTVLINKSGALVDSMYIAQWSDPDLGHAGDDFVGCDTTRDLGYVYNGAATDPVYGSAVPAVGYVLLQGPVVAGAPTDTALFLSSQRPGFRNLRLSAFTLFGTPFGDPAQGVNGDVQWYRILKGLTHGAGVPFVDPLTGKTTAFCLAGDPVLSTDGSAGWVDGLGGSTPADRRFNMMMGPFTFANGDTQQVIVACFASQGVNRLASIATMRSDLRAVQSAYAGFSTGRHMPAIVCSASSDSTQAAVSFRVDARGASVTSAAFVLSTYTGQPVTAFVLSDDGLDNDGAMGDGIWGGTTYVPLQRTGMKADLHLTYLDGDTIVWNNAVDHIATARLTIASHTLVSDNINSDGVANPGENVRFVFSLRNDAPFPLSRLAATGTLRDPERGWYDIPVLNSGALFQRAYDAVDGTSYFSFDVPPAYPDTLFRVPIVIKDDSANIWRDTLSFPVQVPPGKVYTTPLTHAAGKASGAYHIQIVDPAQVKDHLYVIRGDYSTGTAWTFTLKDSTTGVVLLDHHPAPDMLGHTIPVVDGFKVLLGTMDQNPGMRSWAVPQGTLRFSPTGGYRGLWLEGFSTSADPYVYDHARGTIGSAMTYAFGGIGTTLSFPRCHNVLLKLANVNNQAVWDPKSAPADTNFSRGYRFLSAVGVTSTPAKPEFAPWIINKASGYPYQDYNYSVPFSAWDMDTDPPGRLAVGHFENNAIDGLLDGRYWPGDTTVDNSVAREMAFIFRSPYTDTPDTALAVNLSNNRTTPLMWVIACNRRAEEPWPGTDQFLINAYHLPSSQDIWVFNPSVVADVQQAEQPLRFALMQNYPNPFNPVTTIRYELPAQSEVTITVYDVLGRAVKHLVRDVQPAGSHAVLWHGDNDAGGTVASGVYFYRCTVGQSDRGGKFDQTMKMIVLR